LQTAQLASVDTLLYIQRLNAIPVLDPLYNSIDVLTVAYRSSPVDMLCPIVVDAVRMRRGHFDEIPVEAPLVRAPGHREQPDRSIVNAKINPS